jgi:hypothetical protein
VPCWSRQPFLWLVVVATIATGIAWGVVVPPFEGLDESHYYQVALASAKGRDISAPPLFFALTTPLVRLSDGREVPFRIRANPAYRPGFNRHGEVNFFLHDRTHGVAEYHVRQLYVLRGVVLVLWVLTMVAAYEIGKLVLGDRELALLATGLCLFLPQVSFFLAKVHTDTMATLVSTLAYLVLVARAVGKIGRLQSLLASAALLAMTPWADRQAYPLFLTVPIALILVERSWRRRMFAAALALIPFAAVVWRVATNRIGGDLAAWVGPLLPSYRGRWWSTDTGNYLMFEALPKTIFGFVGWFNSSLLLPPWLYGAIIALGFLGACGFVLAAASRLAPVARRGMTPRELAVLILAIAVASTVLPNVYTNVLIVRNPDGRYLFPALLPMALLCVIGLQDLARRLRGRSRLPLAACATVVVAAAVMLGAGAPAWIAAGVKGSHYGNQVHLLATIRDVAAGVVIAPLLFLLLRAASRSWPGAVSAAHSSLAPLVTPRGVFVLAGLLNLTLLMTYVRPLYRPLNAAEFASAIHELAERSDFVRAAAVTQIAIDEFPDSAPLRRIAATGGVPPEVRPDLKALARAVRTAGWVQPERLTPLLDREGPSEGAELLRMQLEPELKTDVDAAARLLRRAAAVSMDLDLNRQASVIGLKIEGDPQGGCEVTVFFRPTVVWTGNYLWLHAYPPGSQDYDDLPTAPPAFSGWQPGELAWEAFHSGQQSFTLYGGVATGGNLGPGAALAQVANCTSTR